MSHFPAVSDGLETSFAGLKKKKKKPVSDDIYIYIYNVINLVIWGIVVCCNYLLDVLIMFNCCRHILI